MRFTVKLLAVVTLLVTAGKVLAITASELRDNYQPIVDRNPFGLKPPPPPPSVTNAPPKEKPKLEIFLTGITSVGYPRIPKQAYLMTKEQNKNTNYYALTEGVEKDGIKILNIDDGGRKVRIHTEDGETLLTFNTHGVAPPTMPAPLKPGIPGQPGQMLPGQPGVMPLPQPGVAGQPVQNAGQPPTYPTAANNMGGGTTPTATTPIRQIPSRRVRAGADNTMNMGAGGQVPGANTIQAQPDMDPAEQYIRMHLNKAAAEKQGVLMPPLPVVE